MSVKRSFDFVFALLLMVLMAIPAIISILWILTSSGRPIFYRQERMKTPQKSFMLWKFRTMTNVDKDAGVSGGHKESRITPEGRWLRKLRFDEIPNLWNILRGDMSFVGPRPPLRVYVERFPGLYAEVLKSRPGLTGLATLHYRKEEERLLAACETPEEADEVYSRRCVPKKAQIDIIYSRHSNICFDFLIVFQTMGTMFRRNYKP